jgi:CBS domain-containing protein/ribosome-associated translation inhibitor RaiA
MGLKDIEEVKATDLMSTEPVIASPEESLSEIIGRMKKEDVHEVLVVDDEELLGIVSYDSLIKRRGLPPTTKVAHVLDHVAHIEEHFTLPQIAETMLSTGLRALPVKKGKSLIGVISRTDLVSSIPSFEELAGLSVKSVMSPSVQCVHENDHISRARHLMQELEARSIPVVDEHGELVGVVGLKDIAPLVVQPLKRGEDAGLDAGPVDIEVRSIMSSPPVSVTEDASISKVIDLLKKHDISNIAVVEGKIPIGIVTQIDLVELFISYRKGDELYVQISGLEEGPEVYEAMYDLIGKTMRRISKIVTPKVLNMHVVKRHAKGDSFKHSVRVRMATDTEMYYAKSFDWDLFVALDDTLDQLEKNVKKEKERRLDARKRRRLKS